MSKIFWFIKGYIWLEICGAAPGTALNHLNNSGVAFWNLRWIDPLTVRLCVFRKNYNQAQKVIEASLCDCRRLEDRGVWKTGSAIKKRPVLILFVILTISAAVMIPQYVFFFDVVGAERVSEQKILWELQELGLKPGIYGPDIHPHRIKNQLLRRMPELQWVTVAQNGCCAKIIVRERPETAEIKSKKGYANVMATQSGIITSQSVTAGQPRFSVGDTVKKGDVLVSGIVDLERIYVIENAEAEIYARTWRSNSVCIPEKYLKIDGRSKKSSSLWLTAGQKRIKIFGNSGISHDSCVKMVSETELVLPGGLSLPLSFQWETYYDCDLVPVVLEKDQARNLLYNSVIEAVQQEMMAGEILSTSDQIRREAGCYQLDVTLACHEMIAEAIPAKWNYEELVHD